MWPSISPHGSEVPNSVWNLSYGTWSAFAKAADAWLEANKSKG